jgi:hypothetical protein
MIDLPDELILLLLEKIGDGNSLLRCRKTCLLLYRISLDRILLLKFNGITTTGDGLLLPEEVMNNNKLFTTVIEDGRWRRMIDNLARSRFRLFETLMPDNGVQSFLTMTIINDAAQCVARDAAYDAICNVNWHDALDTAPDAALDAAWDVARDIALDAAWDATNNIVPSWINTWQAALGTALRNRYTFDEIKDIIKNIITGESNPIIMGKRAWYVAEYLYLTRMIHDDTWKTVYHLLDEVELPETIPPFWDSPTLQGNTHAMEYKRLFSALGEK